jgi:hypothetical protein
MAGAREQSQPRGPHGALFNQARRVPVLGPGGRAHRQVEQRPIVAQLAELRRGLGSPPGQDRGDQTHQVDPR